LSDLTLAIDKVIKHEGGLSLDPADPGNWTGGARGAGELRGTNFGISAAAYPTLDIKSLTEADARLIYARDYATPLFTQLNSQYVLNALVDYAVTSGVKHAVAELQLAAGMAKADGLVGPATLACANALPDLSLVLRLTRRRVLFYWSLPDEHRYFQSWLARALDWA
jgi:lysozyme family protein